MQWRNSPARFGTISKTLHWGMALLMIGMLTAGVFMGGIEDLSLKFKVYNLHKSIGISILALVICRILWHSYSKKPPLVAGLKTWEQWAAQGAHWFLYIGMIGMPLSGWAMSSAFGRSVNLFGFGTLPDFVAKNQALGEQLATVHGLLGYTLIGAVLLHAGAALNHHFIKKDATLRRMLPFAGE